MDLRTPQEPSRRPPGSSLGDGLHFAKRCEPLERVALDLPNPLARETEAEPHVLERLGFDAAESVAEHEHLAVAIRQRRQRLRERQSAERDVGLLLGQWVVAGDEVAEDRVLLLADRWSRLTLARAAARTSCACWSGRFASVAISSSAGSRPSCVQSARSARFIFCSRSTMWTGSRIVRALSASALAAACRIHQVA